MAKKDEVANRQLRVASLLARGLTQREIVVMLEKNNYVTTDKAGNLKPWSLGTINADVKKIRLLWADDLKVRASAHAARILAELKEVKRAGWMKNDQKTVLSALDQEMKLLQLHNITVLTGPARELDMEEMSDEELAAIAKGEV